ncbi:hypothetical protein [Proteiniphilum acetatigenes]|uniref:hypothetical protein n=1 Tax=Proteiniphilum acetatigenes TaxID=294710 RepID=UPI0003787377|nr:hypothetical protein [Proteiniphilum acetatigenes]
MEDEAKQIISTQLWDLSKNNKLEFDDPFKKRDKEKSIGLSEIKEINQVAIIKPQEESIYSFTGRGSIKFTDKISGGYTYDICDFFGLAKIKTNIDNEIESMEIVDKIILLS